MHDKWANPVDWRKTSNTNKMYIHAWKNINSNPDKDLISHLSKADIRIHIYIHTISLKDMIFSNLKHWKMNIRLIGEMAIHTSIWQFDIYN